MYVLKLVCIYRFLIPVRFYVSIPWQDFILRSAEYFLFHLFRVLSLSSTPAPYSAMPVSTTAFLVRIYNDLITGISCLSKSFVDFPFTRLSLLRDSSAEFQLNVCTSFPPFRNIHCVKRGICYYRSLSSLATLRYQRTLRCFFSSSWRITPPFYLFPKILSFESSSNRGITLMNNVQVENGLIS